MITCTAFLKNGCLCIQWKEDKYGLFIEFGNTYKQRGMKQNIRKWETCYRGPFRFGFFSFPPFLLSLIRDIICS